MSHPLESPMATTSKPLPAPGYSVALLALLTFLPLNDGGAIVRGQEDTNKTPPPKSHSIFDQGILLAPRAFRHAASRLKPSIVVIESFGGSTVARGRMSGLRGQGEGNTTGVVLTSDGWIVTSTFNFVQQPPVVTVLTSNGERHVARLAGRDRTRNICLLKIEGVENLTVPQWVAPEKVRVGQWAISIGVGYGDDIAALSTGIISAKGRGSGRALQTDANISPANYGGPLIDIDGRVMGICVPLNPTAPGPAAGVEWYDSGIGFAIPISPSEKWLTQLKQGKNLEFGFLGLNVKMQDEHVTVQEVTDKSPAEEAGVAQDDQILQLNGVKIQDTAQLGVELRRYLAGDTISLELQRESERVSVDVTLGLSPSAQPEIPPLQITPVQPDSPGR